MGRPEANNQMECDAFITSCQASPQPPPKSWEMEQSANRGGPPLNTQQNVQMLRAVEGDPLAYFIFMPEVINFFGFLQRKQGESQHILMSAENLNFNLQSPLNAWRQDPEKGLCGDDTAGTMFVPVFNCWLIRPIRCSCPLGASIASRLRAYGKEG
jgi:hypothetical protein